MSYENRVHRFGDFRALSLGEFIALVYSKLNISELKIMVNEARNWLADIPSQPTVGHEALVRIKISQTNKSMESLFRSALLTSLNH